MDKTFLVIIFQIITVLIFIAIITFLVRFNYALKLEKRISKYSVRYSGKDEELSSFDKVKNVYLNFVKSQRKKIKKMFPTLVSRYDKYSLGSNQKSVDYITHKLVISILAVLFMILAMSIQGMVPNLFQIVLMMVFGFYILDIYLIINIRINKKKIENDMLRAIIIINNAFKSGKSTIQAVEIASKKLPKPIGAEFKKIYEELQYGLSVDTVFDRFAKRVDIEEASYLSSSLTILNKTGGNIVAVFDSIEKTLFDKKKLKEELKNSTTVSKLVVKILLFVPIFFTIIIYLLNPDYFAPFFASPLGYVFLGIILVMFIVYAILLSRIVKVEY